MELFSILVDLLVLAEAATRPLTGTPISVTVFVLGMWAFIWILTHLVGGGR